MSTVFEYDQSESIETNGKFVDKPGKYHAIVTAVNPNPIKSDQTPILNCLQIDLEILDGTDKSQIEKTLSCDIYLPVTKGDKPDSDKALKFKSERLTRFFVAVGYPHLPGKKMQVDLEEIPGRQLVIELQFKKDKDGKLSEKWLEIAGSHVYHVDDPAVVKVPKSEAFLASVPESLRKRNSEIEPGKTTATTTTTTTTAAPTALDSI